MRLPELTLPENLTDENTYSDERRDILMPCILRYILRSRINVLYGQLPFVAAQ
jgi:hypothetical protein